MGVPLARAGSGKSSLTFARRLADLVYLGGSPLLHHVPPIALPTPILEARPAGWWRHTAANSSRGSADGLRACGPSSPRAASTCSAGTWTTTAAPSSPAIDRGTFIALRQRARRRGGAAADGLRLRRGGFEEISACRRRPRASGSTTRWGSFDQSWLRGRDHWTAASTCSSAATFPWRRVSRAPPRSRSGRRSRSTERSSSAWIRWSASLPPSTPSGDAVRDHGPLRGPRPSAASCGSTARTSPSSICRSTSRSSRSASSTAA